MWTLWKRVSPLAHRCAHSDVVRRSVYSKVTGVPRDWLAKLYAPIDLRPQALLRKAREKQFQELVKDHTYRIERHQALGSDLATAHFVTHRGGAVKFVGSNMWIEKKENEEVSLPNKYVPDLCLEAVDVSDTKMMYVSFDNFVGLEHLQYLNVARCEYVDDYCLDHFVMFRDTLVCLDISGCPHITEHGIASLHKLKNLRSLRMYDMPKVEKKELLMLLLEEVMPQCVVESEVDYADPTALKRPDNVPFPSHKLEDEDLQHMPGVMFDAPHQSLHQVLTDNAQAHTGRQAKL